jgi:predicted lipase
MKNRFVPTLLSAALGLSLGIAIASPVSASAPSPETWVAQTNESPPRSSSSLSAILRPEWVMAVSAFIMALAALSAVAQYYEQQRWKRIEFIRSIIKDFENNPAIANVLSIIDFEEFREFPLTLPGREDCIFFEPKDYRLRNALQPHSAAIQRKRDVEVLKEMGDRDRYKQELKEYLIEVTLRDWFDEFLGGLASFEYYIKSKLITADELRPYILYWIRLIGDREYRREGASGFYEQLFTYIHVADYSDVQKLFSRFGYRILPTPYHADDFNEAFDKFTAKRALSLGKVAYLVYSDEKYVREVVASWGINPNVDFKYIDDPHSETQGVLFRTENNIILAFRGTQEMRDWRTNIKIKLRKFSGKSKLETVDLETEIVSLLKSEEVFHENARVHRGFQNAWDSVSQEAIASILRWRRVCPKANIWVTGHSLGGALATMAAAALQDNGVKVSGLYTFGQPRVGDWVFQRQFNKALGDRAFRYVNNNDIVPEVPPPVLPWTFPRVYRHIGQKYYFDVQGNLTKNPGAVKRVTDFFLGYLAGTLEQGFDGINDHRMELYVSHLQKAREAEQVALQLEKEDKEDHK